MRDYLIRRFLVLIPVFLGISIIVFALINLAPGDPYASMLDSSVTVEDRETMLNAIGYYDPLPVKYVKWLSRAVQGDLGYSIRYREPVVDVLLRRLKNTMLLMVPSLVLSVIIGLPLGVISATRQYSIFDYVATILAFLGISIPAFFLALGLVKFFAYDLGWFAVSGMQSVGKDLSGIDRLLDIFAHISLPIIVITLVQTAAFMRYTRSAMLEVMQQDFIRTARGKGLSHRQVVYQHGFRNAMLPVVTVISISVGYLVSGAVLTETVFAWPGMGTLLYQSVANRDFPLMMGGTFVVAVFVLFSNLFADILYTLIDPRIRYKTTEKR